MQSDWVNRFSVTWHNYYIYAKQTRPFLLHAKGVGTPDYSLPHYKPRSIITAFISAVNIHLSFNLLRSWRDYLPNVNCSEHRDHGTELLDFKKLQLQSILLFVIDVEVLMLFPQPLFSWMLYAHDTHQTGPHIIIT